MHTFVDGRCPARLGRLGRLGLLFLLPALLLLIGSLHDHAASPPSLRYGGLRLDCVNLVQGGLLVRVGYSVEAHVARLRILADGWLTALAFCFASSAGRCHRHIQL